MPASSRIGPQVRWLDIAPNLAGALSMAAGEYISVSSQRDTEAADIQKEREEQAKGPAARARELDELVQIYMERGLDYELARQVCSGHVGCLHMII